MQFGGPALHGHQQPYAWNCLHVQCGRRRQVRSEQATKRAGVPVLSQMNCRRQGLARGRVKAPLVGIVANPASGRDVRRLVAKASVFHTAEKCNMIQRALTALAAVGVDEVLMMPDTGGISAGVNRAITQNIAYQAQRWPKVSFIDMPIENSAADSMRAVEHMVAVGVAVIIVMGGDGTHRVVASRCGKTPLVALSTGTNNAFPEIREATVAGLAAGLVATEAVPLNGSTISNKVLRLNLNGRHQELALIDVCVTTDYWAGAKALWKPEDFRELFITVAKADAIGLSAIGGLVHPVDRHAAHGLKLDLVPPAPGVMTLQVAIAPGLIARVGVGKVHEIYPGEDWPLQTPRGMVALDGEREIEFGPQDHLAVSIHMDGPLTVDIGNVMKLAVERQLFTETSAPETSKVV